MSKLVPRTISFTATEAVRVRYSIPPMRCLVTAGPCGGTRPGPPPRTQIFIMDGSHDVSKSTGYRQEFGLGKGLMFLKSLEHRFLLDIEVPEKAII